MFHVIHSKSAYFAKNSKKTWNYISYLNRTCTTQVIRQDSRKCLKIMKGNQSKCYYYLWLRDHCRCSECYNHVTSQRKVTIDKIPFEVKPQDTIIDDNKSLKIIWDDLHESQFLLPWLEDCDYDNYVKRHRRKYKLWSAAKLKSLPVEYVKYEELASSDSATVALLKSLVDFGVAFVIGVPTNVEATRIAAEKIAPVQNTMFGEMWEFTDDLKRRDTAYTNEGLDSHTDNTYFSESAGLQLLHCLFHDGKGGETVLVDGFKAASILQENFPETFRRLATKVTDAEFVEEGHHHKCSGPIMKLNPLTEQIEQIRFNLIDRAPLILPSDQIMLFYDDLRILTNILKDRDLEWQFKLHPGTLLIIDNFRVLHGRRAFTGKRKMCGCYLSRTDFLSKARISKLIEN